MPLWDGSKPLHGKSVVIHAEQGLGDTLQFAQLVPRLKALGARVILEVQKPLLGLFEDFDAAEQIIDQDAERSGADFHCPLMSVPRGLALRLIDGRSASDRRVVRGSVWCGVETQNMLTIARGA
jgi:hypothetical protein